MALVFLIGPPAVGKMTVGQELEQVTGYKLFHNHIPIEVVAPFFSYGTPQGRKLVERLRTAFFDAFLEALGCSYILTFVWAYGVSGERAYIEGIAKRFEESGHDIFWVELEASLDERLRRNRTDNRLQHKPTKRDLDWSEHHLLEAEAKYRFNSQSGEMDNRRYLRLDTTNISARRTAQKIADHFGFKRAG